MLRRDWLKLVGGVIIHVSIWSPKSPSKRKRKISDPVQSDKSPYTDRKIKKPMWQHKNATTKTSITQRLRTDLGRSVGVTIATQLVWLNFFESVVLLWITGTFFHSMHYGKRWKKDSRLKYSENVRMCEYYDMPFYKQSKSIVKASAHSFKLPCTRH